MNNLSEPVGLRSPDGREAQLLSVQVHGEILGLMLRLTVRQVWRNASGAPMASRLGFMLGADQTLLSLQAERGGTSQTLTRIERDSRQRCHTTLGVLATGEQLTLQWRIGQLLSLQGGSLRVQLPASLAPRAAHALQLSFEVHDPVARGTVSSPTHDLQRVRHANGMTLSLRPQAALDKDLVLTVHGLRETGFAVASPDHSQPGVCTLLASASARVRADATEQAALRMKLLVDSSSAMPGERLAQVRVALDRLLGQLRADDQLSYSRFGERVVHDLPRMQACTEAYLRRVRALARHTDTDLGLPAPGAALKSAIAVTDEDESPVTQACVLMITSSPIWTIEAPLRELLAAGHRLHVLAIGTHAAESLWRELAEASGGACETLGHGQHALQALARLIDHMRSLFALQSSLDIQGAQVEQVDHGPNLAADGETLHLWAHVRADQTPLDLTGSPKLQASLRWQRSDRPDAPAVAIAPVAVLWDAQGDLARLCAARDALRLPEDEARQALRQRHQLPWPDSSRLASAEAPASPSAAAAQPPVLQRPKVLPTTPLPSAPLPTAPRQRPVAPAPSRAVQARTAPPRHGDLSGWLASPDPAGNPLTALVQGFNAHAGAYGSFRAALSATLHDVPTRFLDGLVLQLTRQAGSPGRVWALLLHWLHTDRDLGLQPQALALVEQELAATPVSVRNDIHAAFVVAATPTVTRQAA